MSKEKYDELRRRRLKKDATGLEEKGLEFINKMRR